MPVQLSCFLIVWMRGVSTGAPTLASSLVYYSKWSRIEIDSAERSLLVQHSPNTMIRALTLATHFALGNVPLHRRRVHQHVFVCSLSLRLHQVPDFDTANVMCTARIRFEIFKLTTVVSMTRLRRRQRQQRVEPATRVGLRR